MSHSSTYNINKKKLILIWIVFDVVLTFITVNKWKLSNEVNVMMIDIIPIPMLSITNESEICFNSFKKATNSNGKWISMNNTMYQKMKKMGWDYKYHIPGRDYFCGDSKGYQFRIYIPTNCEHAIFSNHKNMLLPSNITILFLGNSHIFQIYSSIIKRAFEMNIITDFYSANNNLSNCFCGNFLFKSDCLVDHKLMGLDPRTLSHFKMINNAKLYSLINTPLQINGINGIIHGIKLHKNLTIKDIDIIIMNEGNPNYWFQYMFAEKCIQYTNIKNISKIKQFPNKMVMDNIIDDIKYKLERFGLREDVLILKLPYGYDMRLRNLSNTRYNFNFLNMIQTDSDLLFERHEINSSEYIWFDHQCMPGVPDAFAQIVIETAFEYVFNKTNLSI